jgi:hypothetical protein
VILGLALLAVACRVAALPRAPALGIDEARYLVAAHHLRNGMGYSDWRGPEIDIHPLHPTLTAALGGARETLEWRGRMVTLAASCLLLAPLALLAWRLGGGAGCAVTLLLAGTHPWLVRNAVSDQPESLYVLLVACALVLLWPETGVPARTWRWILAGLLFGLAYLARPEGLPVAVAAMTVALIARRREGGIAARVALALGLALVAASPYLLFLRAKTGEWTLTGKFAELFFVGQALHDAGQTPPDVSAYLDLIERWKTVSAFILANPAIVLRRAAENAARIFGWIVPRSLGPAGLLGVILCGALWVRRRDLRPRLLLVACPSLTLLLMLLTFKNERVIASVLPFLFVLASAGLATLLDLMGARWQQSRSAAIGLLLLLAASLWTGPLLRARAGVRSPGRPLDRQVARLALREAGDAASIASNNPALSFYVGDPAMFGPPGNYEPLPWSASCRELAALLRLRGDRVAILDGDLEGPIAGREAGCGLRLAGRFTDTTLDRSLTVLTLDPASGRTP